MRSLLGGLAAFGVLGVAFGVEDAATPAAPTRTVDFFKHVRPILAQHCFHCHGPDSESRKGDLRLDVKEEALAERDGVWIVKPGDPAASELLHRIHAEDARDRMPPPKTGDSLTEKQVAVLEAWISEGADWPEHWSFEAIARPALPTVADPTWVRDPLDAFVLSRLEKEGLRPESEATRESWLRRASFDLTGMPPTVAELDEFVKDTAPSAYEKQVDRLLASPRYGERQASEWMDLARYADTGGYQRDASRSNWKWRDWVVNAFNANMPYDRFAIEQLAGDLLPNATPEQRIATGFNRNHPTNSEAGEEEDEYRSAYVIDRVNTTSTVFMGLTLGCAQCHDHKYDPLSQQDYYSFYAFFNNVKERDSDGFGGGNPRPTMSVPNADQAPRYADLEKRIKDLEQRLDRDDPLSDADQKEWEERMRGHLGPDVAWTAFEPAGLISRNGSLLKRLDDGSILAHGPTPVKDVYDVVLSPGKKRITGLRIEVLPDASQPKGSSGRASDGRFILSRLEIRNSTLSESSDPPLVYITKAAADITQKTDFESLEATFDDGGPGAIDSSIAVEAAKEGGDGDFGNMRGGGGWSLAGDARREPHDAILLPIEPLETNDASVIRVTMHFSSTQKFKSLIGRFRLSYTEDERIRSQMLPVAPKHWAAVGPFGAADVATAFTTAFAPESELKAGIDRTQKYEKPVVAKADEGKDGKAAKDTKDTKDTKDAKPAGEGAKGAASEDKKRGKSEAGSPSVAAAESAKPADGGAKPTDAVDPAGGANDAAPEATPAEAGAKPAGKFGGKKKFGGKPQGDAESGENAAKDEARASVADGAPGTAAPAEAKPEAAKPESAKPEVAKSTDGKPAESKAGEAKPVAAKPESKPADAKPNEGEAGDREERKKPEKLAWTDKATWKDGDRQKLDGENSAWYLTRKIHCERPVTVTMRLDGPEGMKVWLNGEEVHSAAPPEKAPEAPKKTGEDEFDFFQAMRGGSATGKKLELGLRAGVNEIVVKAVYGAAPKAQGRSGGGGGGGGFGGFGGGSRGGGGGGSFTFDLTIHGEDSLTYEVAQALRAEFAARVAPTAPAVPTVVDGSQVPAANGAAAPAVELSGPNARDVVAAKDPVADQGATEPTSEQKLAAAAQAEQKRAAARAKVIRDFYRRNVSTVGRVLAAELDRLKEDRDALKRQMPETMVMDEMTKARETFIFKRGHYKNKGDKVQAATPTVLPPIPADLPRNRLGLATWLMSKEHPLTARVTVNRIWQQHFGIGFVKTADDFGIRSELPTHPELLDYLASEFVDSGWDLKKLHRRIVLSATYRQAATISAEKREKDPENRLLARGPRLRLTAEMIRDHALAISGLLVEEVGGKPVKPYQPAGLWSAITGGRDYVRDTDSGQYRRGLYVYWKRGVPYPSFITFDAAKRETCTVTRAYTTTPLQALVLLNDPVYVEAARMFGQRMLKEGGKDDVKRLTFGFRLATSRTPTNAELEVLTKLLTDERAHFKQDAEAVKKLLAVGDAKHDPKLDTAEIAAWSQVASALLNLDSTIRRG